ncbi:MAG: DUF5808 domain-containing protein [Terriglobia bacterium]
MFYHGLLLFVVIELFAFGVAGGIFALLPFWSRPSIYFAITVLPEFRHSPEGRRILRGYQKDVLIHSLIGLGLLLAGWKLHLAGGSVAGLLWQFIGCSYAHHRAKKLVAPHAVRPSTLREASLEPRGAKLPGGWPIQSGPFAILLLTGIYLRAHWVRIPERFPIHWDLQGHANGWSSKSFPGVYGLLVGVAGIVAVLLLLSREVGQHAKRDGVMGHERHFRRSNIWSLTICSYFLAVIAAVAALTPLHPTPNAGVVFAVTTVILVLVMLVVLMWYRMNDMRDKSGVPAGAAAVPVGDRTEDRYWKWGFYMNPNDSALVVEKRVGIGFTLNMANPKAWVILALIVGASLLMPVLHLFHHAG